MASGRQFITIGVFDDPTSADRAMVALQQAGFSKDQIRHTTEQENTSSKGIKALFTGEKATPRRSVMDDLVNMGIDSEDARLYQREYESGHVLVSVMGQGDMQDASTILVDHGAHAPAGLTNRQADYDTRTRDTASTSNAPADLAGRQADYDTRARDTASTSNTQAGLSGSRADEATAARDAETQKIRLHAERLKAYKQPEEVGEVNIRKEVVTEQQTLNVPVTREEVVIERRSLAEDAAAAEGPIKEGETIRIPISEERVNVTKETVPTGEVEISKRKVEENRQFSDTVQHEEARFENEGDIPIIDRGMNQPPDQPQSQV